MRITQIYICTYTHIYICTHTYIYVLDNLGEEVSVCKIITDGHSIVRKRVVIYENRKEFISTHKVLVWDGGGICYNRRQGLCNESSSIKFHPSHTELAEF